jgi:hypothetical protein
MRQLHIVDREKTNFRGLDEWSKRGMRASSGHGLVVSPFEFFLTVL